MLINPSDGERYLDAPEAEPFLAAAVALDVPLFLHPSRDLPAPEDSREFALGVSLARPHQTAICIARMIYSGTFDRHPSLRLLLAHGGGTLPFVAGRLDATWQGYRPGRWDGPDVLTRPPSSYLARLCLRHQHLVRAGPEAGDRDVRHGARAVRQRPAAGLGAAGRPDRDPGRAWASPNPTWRRSAGGTPPASSGCQ